MSPAEAHFSVFPGKKRLGRKQQWYWRLVAANGEVIAQSEGYVSRYNAQRAAALTRETLSRNVQIHIRDTWA